MGHGLTWKGGLYLLGNFGFLWYISSAHRGPWQNDGKFELPAKAYERYKNLPMFADNFQPDSHPNVHNNMEKYEAQLSS